MGTERCGAERVMDFPELHESIAQKVYASCCTSLAYLGRVGGGEATKQRGQFVRAHEGGLVLVVL